MGCGGELSGGGFSHPRRWIPTPRLARVRALRRNAAMSCAFRAATPADLETIRELADRIWHACYPGLITPEQIRYMLGWMYAPHKLAGELARGVTYELVEHAGKPVGYLAHELQAGGATLHLNKLYLLPEWHGLGLGQRMLRRVLTAARGAGAVEVELRVNRGNTRAVRAYERAGFRITATVCQDIGAGYVMDDYVMRRPVTADDAPEGFPPSAACPEPA